MDLFDISSESNKFSEESMWMYITFQILYAEIAFNNFKTKTEG